MQRKPCETWVSLLGRRVGQGHGHCGQSHKTLLLQTSPHTLHSGDEEIKRIWVHWAKKQKKRRTPSWQMNWEDPYRLLVLRKPAASEKLQGRSERPLPHFREFSRGRARRVQQKTADKAQNNSDTRGVPQFEGLRRTPLDAGDVANKGGWGAAIVF